MEHRIKVKISDRIYVKHIASEDEEAAVRKVVADINESISQLSQTHPNVSVIDILTIVALNEGIERVKLGNALDKNCAEYNKLAADLENYVSSLK